MRADGGWEGVLSLKNADVGGKNAEKVEIFMKIRPKMIDRTNTLRRMGLLEVPFTKTG